MSIVLLMALSMDCMSLLLRCFKPRLVQLQLLPELSSLFYRYTSSTMRRDSRLRCQGDAAPAHEEVPARLKKLGHTHTDTQTTVFYLYRLADPASRLRLPARPG